ncbi:MAG: hypothetical protein FWF41_03170 [Betaproteobacteria bacterium]|nr:hypothetical protein [Betaproteobacteria bacterium]
MSEAFIKGLMQPESYIFLYLFAVLFIIVMFKSFFYDFRVFLIIAIVFLPLALLWGAEYKKAAIIGFAILGVGIVGWIICYLYRDRKTRVTRWLGGGLLACAVLTVLMALKPVVGL